MDDRLACVLRGVTDMDDSDRRKMLALMRGVRALCEQSAPGSVSDESLLHFARTGWAGRAALTAGSGRVARILVHEANSPPQAATLAAALHTCREANRGDRGACMAEARELASNYFSISPPST